jgi:LPXTG-site transpeptidase (sortase) family protein
MKETIIYQSTGPESGEIRFKPKRRFRFLFRAFIIGGLIGAFILFSPFVLMEVQYRTKQVIRKRWTNKPAIDFGEIIRQTDIDILQPVNPEFSLVIPKIDVNSEIFANVNPADKKEYQPLLKRGVAHAAGTYLPGENGTVYLFGHSSDFIWNILRFNTVFYLLKDLQEGDQVNIFYQGKRHVYRVANKKVVDSADLYYLKPKTGQEELVIQTCWPPATNWKRLLVFAQPLSYNY